MRFSLQDVKKSVHRRAGGLNLSLHLLRPGELRNEIGCLIAYHERLLGQTQRSFSSDEARACIGDYRLANGLMCWRCWIALLVRMRPIGSRQRQNRCLCRCSCGWRSMIMSMSIIMAFWIRGS